MRRNVIFIFIVLIAFVLVSCGSSVGFYDDNERDTIVIGLEADYAPYNWAMQEANEFTHPLYGRNDYAEGYDVQMAKIIAEGLGKKLVIKAIDWDGLVAAVKSGEIDLIIAGMTPTAEREKSLLFSEEYYRADPVIVLRKDSSYANASSINDFNNAKVVAQLGTIYETLVGQINGAIPKDSLKDYNTLMLAIKNKDADIMIAELPVAIGMTNKDQSLTYIRFNENNGFNVETKQVIVSIGMNLKNSALKVRIDEILSKISFEERDEIMNGAILRQ